MTTDVRFNRRVQFGKNADPAKNFMAEVLDGDDGTFRIVRGVEGNVIEEVLRVNALGQIITKNGDNLGDFASKNHTQNGYQKLPGGLIVQWGITGTVTAGTRLNITYPIAFPNFVGSVTATVGSSATTAGHYCITLNLNTSQFGIAINTGSAACLWVAIGY